MRQAPRQLSAFEELIHIVGRERAKKLIELMPGRLVRIRKKKINIMHEYLGNTRLLAMPIATAVRILGCSRQYVRLLRRKKNLPV